MQLRYNNLGKIIFFGFLASAIFERSVWIIYLQKQGFSIAEISLLQMSLNLTGFVFEIPAGHISDKYGRKVALALGCLCVILYLFGMLYFTTTLLSAVMVFALYGVGLAMMSGADRCLIYDELSYKGKSSLYHKIIGVYIAITTLSLALFSFLGGVLSQANYWQHIFYLGIFFQVLALVSLIFVVDFYKKNALVPEQVQAKPTFLSIFKTIGSFNVKVIFLILTIGLFEGVIISIILFYQKILDNIDFSLTLIAFIVSLSFIFSAVSAMVSGVIAAKIGEVKSIIVFSSLLLLSFVLSLLLGSKWVVLNFIILTVSYEIIVTSLNVVLNHETESSKRGVTLSAATAIFHLTTLVSFAIIGYFSSRFEFNQFIFTYGILATLVCIGIFGLYAYKQSKQL